MRILLSEGEDLEVGLIVEDFERVILVKFVNLHNVHRADSIEALAAYVPSTQQHILGGNKPYCCCTMHACGDNPEAHSPVHF